MSQINSNTKDDFQVVLLLSCFVGNPVTPQDEAQNLPHPHPLLEQGDLRKDKSDWDRPSSREDGANPTPTLHGVMTDGA